MKAITHCHLPYIIFSMLGVMMILFGMSPSYAANDDLATTIPVVNGDYPKNNNVQASTPHHNQKIYAPTSEVTNSGRVKAYSSSVSVAKYNDNKERRAKAKLTKSQRHTRHKCRIDQFLGTYYYSGGCGGMSFEMSIKCEHNVFGHHQLCKFEERSVS